jgi:DNA gyrase subunit A
VLTIRLDESRGELVGATSTAEGDDLVTITQGGIVTRQTVDAIPRIGRATKGVIVQRLRDDDRIAAVAIVREPVSVIDEDPALPAVPDDESTEDNAT